MIYYLNFGFIVEQALVDLIQRYMDRQKFDDVYGNFHINVVNEHPFAHMIMDPNARASDNFPAVIITSQSDSKTGDLINTPPQAFAVGYTSDDLDALKDLVYRTKTKINSNGEVVTVKKNNEEVKEKIPGLIFVYDDTAFQTLKDTADSRTEGETKGMVYGIKTVCKRTDKISVEIWAENNQLKNELYEHLRLMFASTLNSVLKESYALFSPVVWEKSINGERSANYNFDFDVLLNGSHITFDFDYDITQIILDTDVSDVNKDLVVEVINHVKN